MCVDAVVDADLRTIRGVLVASGLDDAAWVDAIATLPMPTHDLDIERTFPGRPNAGSVAWSEADTTGACPPGSRALAFTTSLPNRLGDTGTTAAGLQANGGWYPQPIVGGHLAIVDWDVRVRLPDGATGALGGEVGEQIVTWRGTSDRASLAVIPRATVTSIRQDGWSVELVTRGKPRPGMAHRFAEQLPLLRLDGRAWSGAVIEAPLRRRLVVPGAGQAWVSDRSWRVFPWFARMHDVGILRGVTASFAPQADAFDRQLAGAATAMLHQREVTRRAAFDVMGLVRWIPAVDNALYDPEMPFQDELFHRTHGLDRVKDELRERLDPTSPATAALAQLGDAHGEDVAIGVGMRVARGWPVDAALAAQGLPGDALDAFRAPYPAQDYTIDLVDGEVFVRREAPLDALAETVVVRTQAETVTLQVGPGPGEVTAPLTHPATRVRLDPAAHLAQTSRVGESRPPRIRWTLNGQIDAINVSQRFVDAFAVLTARRSDDTRNRFRIWAFTDQRQYLGGRASYTRFFGPLTRMSTRAHQVSFAFDVSWLNPNFSVIKDARYTLGGSAGWFWDGRVTTLFPLRGARFSLNVAAGGAPETGQAYATLTGTGMGLFPLAPRHVIAARFAGGASFTDIPQQRLRFGGTGGVRGIPDLAVQTELQGVGSLEYRAAPLRGASIPLGVLYIEEIDLVAGLDAGVGMVDGGRVGGVGASVGVNVITENLGLSPGSVNATLGFPLAWSGFEMPERKLPFELYISWGFSF